MNSSNLIKNAKNWILLDKLIQSPNSVIYNIAPIIDENTPEEDIKDLTSTKWIVKISEDNVENLVVEELKLYENDLFVKIPKNINFRNNGLLQNNWYTMERLDSSIGENYIFARKKIYELRKYMMNFFEWLHIKENKIYGDIKVNNIMINKKGTKSQFVIIDYETISTPDLRYICDEKSFNNYYYFYIGCDFGKPYFSYRMDLQAFGHILLALVLSTDNYHVFEWQNSAYSLYKTKTQLNYFQNLIKEKENTSIVISNPKHKVLIDKYFEIIKEQEWYASPNVEVYNKLKDLFASNLVLV